MDPFRVILEKACLTVGISLFACASVSRAQVEHPTPAAVPSFAGSRPNMILLIADDVSATDIGCYGNPDVRTPHLKIQDKRHPYFY
jgi:hypothetical protein